MFPARVVALALLGSAACLFAPAAAPRAALAQDEETTESAADLIDDARGVLVIARGWVGRADDPDLEFGQRRAARVEANKLLKDVCAKFGAALEKDSSRESSIASDLRDAQSMLSRVRKMSGIGDEAAGKTASAGAPPPPAERPPTTRAEPPPKAAEDPKPPEPGAAPAPPAPSAPLAPLAWDDWDKTFREIADGSATTVVKLESLRAAVAGKAIEFRGKIEDILPGDAHGAGAVVVKLCGIYGGAPVRSFVVPAADKDKVAGWVRWDRIAWREAVHVASVDKIEYRPIFTGAADLVRTPSPGPVYPRPVKSPLGVTGYQTWILKYVDNYVLRNRWLGATRQLRTVSQKLYAIPAKVVEVEGGKVHVKLGSRLVVRVKGQSRRWGPDDDDVWLEVADPQIREALKPGRAVEVHGDIEYPKSVADVTQRGGTFDMTFSFGRLR